ncbi:hypothetical protein E3O44_06300 [Cryobacterium algoricola]|uniref:Resolvase/invertase-type recombinase catalytic domain-containing protein n=1 Tax=Cryobacterium algoricola TaxID=1259183 RepID=A0ABY2IH23_9MICO|nr:hypothetical protein E3O44_06300 [Cryobacterium algoricola]
MLDALHAGDTLVITTRDRLGRSTQNMHAFANDLRARGAALRVLNLGGADVSTATPMGSTGSRPRDVTGLQRRPRPFRRLISLTRCFSSASLRS